jgi:hypothetical protein
LFVCHRLADRDARIYDQLEMADLRPSQGATEPGKSSMKKIGFAVAALAFSTHIACAAMLLVLSLLWMISVAQAQSGEGRNPTTLVKLWNEENEKCRGGAGDDPRTDAACAARETYAAKLRAVGWCYGKHGQSGYQMSWHGCGPDSLR